MLFQINHTLKYTFKLFWPVSLVIYLGLWEPTYAEDSTGIREYQVKAIFLLRFSKFVTYPENVFSSSDSPLTLCILGDDPFQGTLDVLVKEEKVQKRLIKVNYLRSLEKVSDCHTLFVSSSEQKQLTNVLAYVKQRPVLTISDIENFVIRGGMIQFYTADNTVRFMIDPITVRDANLKISSRVLQIAKIVNRP